MKPLTPTERWAEHRGDASALEVSASGVRPPPAPSIPDVLTPREIHMESARIQLMIANHRFKREAAHLVNQRRTEVISHAQDSDGSGRDRDDSSRSSDGQPRVRGWFQQAVADREVSTVEQRAAQSIRARLMRRS